MNDGIARFNELTPSTLPFVEGRLEGHKQRKNYSIVGPGVAEDSQQSIKISKPHGYNLGAVSANPKNGSGLHSHTTAEVFLIFSGKWRFYWGADGKNEIILSQGDIISMPTNMFRGFENAGEKEGLMFVVLGENDPGIITWVPKVLKNAKETGLALLEDNSLIDLAKDTKPENKKLLEPISDEKIKEFDNYELSEIEKFICKFQNHSNHEKNLNENVKIIQVIGSNFCNSVMEPVIGHKTGFNLSILKTKKGIVKDLIFNTPTIIFSQKGNWKIDINGDKINLNAKDTFSIPLNKKVNISANNNEDCFLNCVSKA